jgi:hypothetical protein
VEVIYSQDRALQTNRALSKVIINYKCGINQIKENEVGRTCGMHGREKSVQGLGGKARRKETTWKTKA